MRKISLFLVAIIIFSCFNGFAYAYVDNCSVSLTVFNGFYSSGASLYASSISRSESIQDAKVVLDANCLTVRGSYRENKVFEIQVTLNNKKFLFPQDATGFYDVLSVFGIENGLRIVLKEKNENNMLYVDVTTGDNRWLDYENYNTNWYVNYVSRDIVFGGESGDQTRNNIATNYKWFSAETNIYGDSYIEIIYVFDSRNYPSIINDQTGGEFVLTLGILSKWTVYTPYGGNSIWTWGCSLGMNCAELNIATPTGEYFSSLYSYFSATPLSTNYPISVGFNLNIPCTPFSVTYSYSYTNNYYAQWSYCVFPATTTYRTTQTGNQWSGSGYWAYNPGNSIYDYGDFFYIKAKVDTMNQYEVIGSKSIGYLWYYHITGTGVNTTYSIALDIPSYNNYFAGYLTYQLCEA